jgi:hypothetical protein
MPVKSSEIKIIDYGKSMHFHDNLTVLKIGIDQKSMTSVMNKFDLSMRKGFAQLIHVHSPILAHIENRKKLKKSIKEPRLNEPGQVTAYSQGDYILFEGMTTVFMKEHCAIKFEHYTKLKIDGTAMDLAEGQSGDFQKDEEIMFIENTMLRLRTPMIVQYDPELGPRLSKVFNKKKYGGIVKVAIKKGRLMSFAAGEEILFSSQTKIGFSAAGPEFSDITYLFPTKVTVKDPPGLVVFAGSISKMKILQTLTFFD